MDRLTDEQISCLPANMLGLQRTANTEELAAWYTAADCLVNPTLEDNMPMVNLEALACGTPIAVFETGGCPEAVDETCGIVVKQGDTAALCNAVIQLCDQKKSVMESCIQRAHIFDCSLTFQSYLALYKELCG